MSLEEIIGFANDNPICNIATTEGDQPRTRIFSMWYADGTGFYFHTDSAKAVARQLKANPKVEVCFYAPAEPPDVGETMRVSGDIEVLDDIGLKTKLVEDRPFLKLLGLSGPEDPMLFVFRIPHGEAYIWTMKDNRRESEIDRIRF